jgi:cellulose synthase/poly-beta-1,6-N-acetylglucosamine synthase-like glycosyltransferase
MRQAQMRDEICMLATPMLAAEPVQQIGAATEPLTPSSKAAISVCVACCATTSMPHDAPLAVAKAIKSFAAVRTILLSETGSEQTDGVEVIAVPHGTKLSKIRRLADIVAADLFCICDPDLTVDGDACRVLLQRAVVEVRSGREVVVFGIVEGKDDGTLLSRVLAVDKWLSHRVLRRFLWAGRVGITLPGQFLIVSPCLLRSLEPDVDSYLDDLYLGWIARQRGVGVHRVPVVVGQEDPRNSWTSLFAQRIRWMKGLTSLGWKLFGNPLAVVLLLTHYMAYCCLPMLIGLGMLWLTITSPPAAAMVFTVLAAVLATLSRESLLTACCYLAVFPWLQLAVSLLWWMPLGKLLLQR